jgi:2-phospho-L-lactate guanylyltransferase
VRTAAILPIKSFPSAKQRLGGALDPGDRRQLAAAMVRDVLDTLAEARLDHVIVVTAEPLAAEAAQALGAVVVTDPVEAGQSAAAARGIAAAVEREAERVLLVPGDCPALHAAEVEHLLAREAGPRVVIVPDRHGTGTNALLLSPPEVIQPSFGPGSFARHAALARGAGAAIEVAELPSLCHDVDTPGDLAALRALLATRTDGAVRTRELLGRLSLPLEGSTPL